MTTDPADPTALPAGNPVGTSLPADILQQSCRRVTLAAGVFAGLWALVLVLGRRHDRLAAATAS